MLKRSLATHFTAEQYLALEDVSDTKHEFYDGKIYNMSGGTADHNLVALNIASTLKTLLEPTPCRVFGSDMRVLVEAEDLYTYPDVSVVCGKLEYAPPQQNHSHQPSPLGRGALPLHAQIRPRRQIQTLQKNHLLAGSDPC